MPVIYIVSPPKFATGGVELLHQLGRNLENSGLTVFMYYYPGTSGDPVHPNYKEYGLNRTGHIEDEPGNWIIVPEIMTQLLHRFRYLHKAIWWLSVDNHFWHLPLPLNVVNYAIYRFTGRQRYIGFDNRLLKIPLHLVQSSYAYEFISNKGSKEVQFLTDYLHSTFLKEAGQNHTKFQRVAYNPNKGKAFTRRLVRSMPDVEFVALRGMSREKMVETLKGCMLYIDFGNHPGKDRIPREAAILGCCLLVSRHGSAGYMDDMPISEKYKLPMNRKVVAEAIRNTLNNYHMLLPEFNDYVQCILKQEERYCQEVSRLVNRLKS